MPNTSSADAQSRQSRLPVVRELLADLDTPLSTYLKLADGPYSYLLESVQGGEKWGRYSIIGLPCRTVIKVHGHRVVVLENNREARSEELSDPLAWIDQYYGGYRSSEIPDMPRFTGGLVGYFGYDAVRYMEPRLDKAQHPDPLGLPDILLLVSEEVVVFDNLSGKLYLIVHVDPDATNSLRQAQQRLDALEGRLRAPLNRSAGTPFRRKVQESDFESSFTQAEHMQAVQRAKEYIVDGDIMQVVISQRMSTPYKAPPLDLYRALRCLNPSPYMFFFNFGDFHVVGSSPEILVRLEDGEVTVRPIAGTRPRGKTEAEDLVLEQELLADPKELAEHLMLIDLGRNDVGRIAKTGSVKVTDRMVIERYSHVMHIVSHVTGQLASGYSPIDVLRATFPAGTLSGAPKIRAMEIIDELEPVKRGVYGGAVGYLSWTGNMDTAIAIRTAVIKDHVLYIQAGGGIVADSVPLDEWEETLNKRRAVFRAVAMAEAGVERLGKEV